MALNEGQLVTYALDEIIETVQNLTPMASKVTKYTPPAESMQRSSNTVWMPVEQEAPTQTGWDLTGNATGILELSVKCNMGDPDNDFFELRADDLRDERSYRRRIQASAKKLANNIESAIAKQATEMGSLVVHDTRAIGPSTGLSGWDFVSDAERLMFSRELNRDMGISYFLNPDDYGTAMNPATTGAAVSYGLLARAYESEPFRNAMLRMANTPRGSTAFEKAMQQAQKAINAMTQGAKSDSLSE